MTKEVKHPVLSEIVDGSMAFFREARNGSANVEQAKVGSTFAQRAISAIGMDLKVRLATPQLNEIEKASAAA